MSESTHINETERPAAIYRKDYQPPKYYVDEVTLHFDLYDDHTVVNSTLKMHRRSDVPAGTPLSLDGMDLELVGVKLNGVAHEKYTLTNHGEGKLTPQTLVVESVPETFELQIENVIHPETNKALEGLYCSGGNFCTQCEPEGFRRITFYPDRSDVMARFTTIIEADKAKHPKLLSNGNLISTEDLGNGRHRATWNDPFPKPSYLFALVAGQLECLEDHFITMSGRDVTLRIYVREPDLPKCEHAMRSLKNAMKWDEDTYGREYDLDLFMIVAVSDFNQGAMENKGLNIFNSSLVLASKETATDADCARIEGVIGHEYFHNWSGDRVTCRSWFELSLKEGFTVFRDQSFSAAMQEETVQRIQDVNILRSRQFAEDAGPLAHAVRPESYVEINNFYTCTIYDKGAEVVRMIATLLGRETFRKGTDLYFSRFDGQAVTIDDFVSCMAEVSGRDFTQFMNWYKQAGTPEVEITLEHNAQAKTATLSVKQSCRPTAECAEKKPYLIPCVLALLDHNGNETPLRLEGEAEAHGTSRLIEITESEQRFVFMDQADKPVLSLFRGFSAPVKAKFAYTRDELAFLMAHDRDGFNRWDAAERMKLDILKEWTLALDAGKTDLELPAVFAEAFGRVLTDETVPPALRALTIGLPDEQTIWAELSEINPSNVHEARSQLIRALAKKFESELATVYHLNRTKEGSDESSEQVGKRALANACLRYLVHQPVGLALAEAQLYAADNMTDERGALSALVHTDSEAAKKGLEYFVTRWQHDSLVVDKWLQLHAESYHREGALDNIKALVKHPLFDINNPNKVRSLVRTFTRLNPSAFHDESGAGYDFLVEMMEILDKKNPLMAAQIFEPLNAWRRFEPVRRELMHKAIEGLLAKQLSPNLYELCSKSVA